MKGFVFVFFVIAIIAAMAFQKSVLDHIIIIAILLLAIFASLKWRE